MTLNTQHLVLGSAPIIHSSSTTNESQYGTSEVLLLTLSLIYVSVYEHRLNVFSVGALLTKGLFLIWKSAFSFLTLVIGKVTAAVSSAVGSAHEPGFIFCSPFCSKNLSNPNSASSAKYLL